MLRRNLLKNIVALISIPFLFENIIPKKCTYFLRTECSGGFWYERILNEKAKELTYKDSTGFCTESSYDENGQLLTYKTSDGYWSEFIYDSNGRKLTYRDNMKELKLKYNLT